MAKQPKVDVRYRGFELPINPNPPLVMHIDMNSCFATMEQQANPLLRGRPIAVAPYVSPRGIIVAPSNEAKAIGIKLGTRIQEAKQICPDLVVLPPDPAKYRDAHTRFKKIFMSYTSKVAPKSIDEAVIDFSGSQIIKHKSLEDVGRQIKKRVAQEIGEWVKVNVGIGTNRFLAKTAAGLNKPDGLDLITKDNLLDIYRQMDLTDLSGINVRFEARLNSCGIYSPLQFFDAPMIKLKKQVFKSIVGYYWYMRLRGWEIDDIDFSRKSFGHTYALGKKTSDKEELAKLLLKLCIKVGRRLRANDYYAEGVHLSMLHTDRSGWHKSMKTRTRLYTNDDIYRHALRVLNMRPSVRTVTNLAISVFNLQPHKPEQIGMFDGSKQDKEALERAIDSINDRYGEFVITPALMLAMDDVIVDRIAFGGVKDLQDLYDE